DDQRGRVAVELLINDLHREVIVHPLVIPVEETPRVRAAQVNGFAVVLDTPDAEFLPLLVLDFLRSCLLALPDLGPAPRTLGENEGIGRTLILLEGRDFLPGILDPVRGPGSPDPQPEREAALPEDIPVSLGVAQPFHPADQRRRPLELLGR